MAPTAGKKNSNVESSSAAPKTKGRVVNKNSDLVGAGRGKAKKTSQTNESATSAGRGRERGTLHSKRNTAVLDDDDDESMDEPLANLLPSKRRKSTGATAPSAPTAMSGIENGSSTAPNDNISSGDTTTPSTDTQTGTYRRPRRSVFRYSSALREVFGSPFHHSDSDSSDDDEPQPSSPPAVINVSSPFVRLEDILIRPGRYTPPRDGPIVIRPGRWTPTRDSPVVITISDDSDNDEEPSGINSGNRDRPEFLLSVPAEEQTAPPNPSLEDDEAYARRLQRQFDAEYRIAEFRRRQSRRIAEAARNRDQAPVETNTGNGTTPSQLTTQPSDDGDAGVPTSTTTSAQTETRERHGIDINRPFEIATPLTSSTRGRPPGVPVPGFVAFHRRPVPNGNNQVQSATGSGTAQIGTNADVNDGNNNNGGNSSSAPPVIDFMRLRRAFFQRALQRGDFGPLDAALFDLAQLLGESLTEEEIKNLPTNVFSSSNAGTSSTNNFTCTICMDEFVDGEVQRRLPCSHMFHKKCIDTWLRQKCTCPICRVDARGKTKSKS